MMLAAVQGLDPAAARLVLSQAASSIVPSAGGWEPSDPILVGADTALIERVLDEARTQLRISADDKSEQTRAKLVNFLTQMVVTQILQGVNRDRIRDRVGDKGALPPSSYEPRFTDEYAAFESTLGDAAREMITRAHVRRAMREPDAVEHVDPTLAGLSEGIKVSVYLKRIPGTSHRSDSTLLVPTRRSGHIQNVREAWRIFHDDVNTDGTNGPVDVLRRFVNKYGLRITLGDRDVGKFVYYDAFNIGIHVDPITSSEKILGIEGMENVKTWASWIMRESPLRVMEISMAYAINMTAYINDLSRHRGR